MLRHSATFLYSYHFLLCCFVLLSFSTSDFPISVRSSPRTEGTRSNAPGTLGGQWFLATHARISGAARPVAVTSGTRTAGPPGWHLFRGETLSRSDARCLCWRGCHHSVRSQRYGRNSGLLS